MRRSVLIATTLAASWLGMQAVHEAGHVIAALVSGGSVARVVLYPLELSRTDLRVDPHPLAVAWGGPIGGVLLPLGLWAIASALRLPLRYLARFFAGFCLVGNGAYVGTGAMGRAGDAGTMFVHGAAPWTLLLFALVTLSLGLFLWHRQGRYFGLGPAPERISWLAIALMSSVCAVLVAVGCVLGKG